MDPIVLAFLAADPSGTGTLPRDTVVRVLRDLLPSTPLDELETLISTCSTDSGIINVRDFVGALFDGHPSCQRQTRTSSKDTESSAVSSAVQDTARSEVCQLGADSNSIANVVRTGEHWQQSEPKLSFHNNELKLPIGSLAVGTQPRIWEQSSSSRHTLSFTGVATPKLSAINKRGSVFPQKLTKQENIAYVYAEAARELLPDRVILVRHGESEGNIDPSVYKHKADNAVELTNTGSAQALEAGKRIKQLVGNEKVQVIVSPFQRTLQTFRNIEESIAQQVVHVMKDPRIREQEFGNLQGDDFKKFRKEQTDVGRYFYRFPTGESGADVHARVKSWWDSTLAHLNLRPGYPHVDTVVVVTHGLTMRFILMQLYDWSPNTFQTIWNAKNCEIYCLKKDLTLPGQSPYSLCVEDGDKPRSTISINVEFKSGVTETYRLDDYLSIPMPRTRQPEIVKAMLQKQYGLDPKEIASVDMYAGKFAKYQ